MNNPDDAPGDFVDSYLLYLLAAASDKASAEFHARVRAAGLRVIEWRVLAILIDRDGAMITRLAEYALMEQSRLTRIVAQMDERGFVSRKSDVDDGRRVRVYLTDKGKRTGLSLVEEARQHEKELLASWDGQNSGKLKPVLQSLLSCLNDRAR